MDSDKTSTEIVDRVLRTFVGHLRARDLGVMTLFADDAALFGSESGETAQGKSELQPFFESIFARSATYGWTWDPPVARRHGDTLWFVASARVMLVNDGGGEASLPYRLSGVLREQPTGDWLFDLFNGSEPADGEPADGEPADGEPADGEPADAEPADASQDDSARAPT